MDKVKVAIMGSCLTRDNFNSMFNKNWNMFFEVVSHQHQSSLISLMSEKIDVKSEIFNGNELSDFDKLHLHRDFTKEFLSELLKVKPDYLIMDFFADVYYGVINIDDNKYITNNQNKIRKTQLNKEFTLSKTMNLISNYDEYKVLLEESLHKFLNYISINLPDTKIIVTKAKFSNQYFDFEKSQLCKYEGNKNNLDINVYNDLFEEINKIIEKKNIRTIDLTQKEYMLDKKHPWGLFYVHYNKEFYNDFLSYFQKYLFEDMQEKINLYGLSDKNSAIKNNVMNKNDGDKTIYKVDVKSIQFDEQKKSLSIEIKDDEKKFNSLYLIERRDGFCNKLFNPKKINYKLARKDNSTYAFIDINKDLYNYLGSTVWDFYVYSEVDKYYYYCDMSEIEHFSMNYIYNEDFNKYIKLYKNSASRLSMIIKDKYVHASIDNIVENGKNILRLSEELYNYSESRAYIRFRKRIHRFINLYSCYVDIPIIRSEAIIESKYFENKKIIQGDVFEAFLVLYKDTNSEYEIPIRLKNNNNEQYINMDKVLSYKIFMSSNNTMSLFFVNRNLIQLENILIQNNENMILEFNNLENIIIKNIEIIPYKNKHYFHKGHEFKSYYIEKNKIYFDINELYNVINLLQNYKFLLKLIVLVNGKQEEIIIRHNNAIKIKSSNLYKISTEKSISNESVFYVKKICKLAILGSGFSRVAFSSSDYYNPDYKEKYNIVLTQFNSSLISLMDNRKRKFDDHYFKHLNNINKEYLRVDFEKDFFEQLKKSEPDYLMIDIYADGQKGIIIFPDDNSVITGSVNVEYSQFMFDLPDKTQVINSRNVEKYIPIWCEAAERFAKEIVKYIPEDRIIINYINVAESYVNVRGEKIKYEKESEVIKTSNILFDWMNDYLRILLPKAKVIDSRKLGYIGYEKHPLGNTPNHFQSEYYKEFIKLVDNIVF